ncbi:DUF4845 domain-containing protein [Marinobacter xestospongiae]|uniref:DUF4845 domain-containing protein n=1 Tax=Marinobacter xestospongiae TaxID=994319 RepID=A0ABU3VST5_9GAMM|nr:DUF4845 domain-containing protein [Marinobacter xestospongiae]MDV2077325.1 DUF4845 domain-containing protein [Marinobacter xestospongiae]
MTGMQAMMKCGQKALERQRGASTLTMLTMVLFFGGLLTLALKLGPIYLDDITIQEAIESLDGTDGLSDMSPVAVRSLIDKRLLVNNVRDFDSDNINIEKDGEVVMITVAYEMRTSIISDIDAVVSFNHEYEMRGQ